MTQLISPGPEIIGHELISPLLLSNKPQPLLLSNNPQRRIKEAYVRIVRAANAGNRLSETKVYHVFVKTSDLLSLYSDALGCDEI